MGEIVAVASHSQQHGCIYFAVCNNRLKIESVENALAGSLRVHGVEVAQIVLAERIDKLEDPSYRVEIEDPVAFFSEKCIGQTDALSGPRFTGTR